MATKKKRSSRSTALDRAFREFVLEADEKELEETLREAGMNPSRLAARGRESVMRVLASADRPPQSVKTAKRNDAGRMRAALSAVLQLLRRREDISIEDLAQKARVEAHEIRKLECDPTYPPSPRTLYQLERFFNLPPRTLARLCGATSVDSQHVREEVLRFAASAKSIGKLSRSEKKLLNDFVRLLNLQETDVR